MPTLEETINGINAGVDKYLKYAPDFADINTLLAVQTYLTGQCLYLSTHLIGVRREYEYAKLKRKNEYAKAFQKHANEMAANRASEAANLDVSGLLEAEAELDAILSGYSRYLSQVNEVVMGVRQRISFLKDEKSLGNFQSRG